jgi:hypothetical protein
LRARHLTGVNSYTFPLLHFLPQHVMFFTAVMMQTMVACPQVLFSASTAALAFAFDHLLNVTYALVYGIGES